MQELVDKVHQAAPSARVSVWPCGHRGVELAANHSLVRAFTDSSVDGAPGSPTRSGTMVCDAKIVQGGGWAPVVVLGPRGGGLHSADEWVELASIDTCLELLGAGVDRFCAP